VHTCALMDIGLAHRDQRRRMVISGLHLRTRDGVHLNRAATRGKGARLRMGTNGHTRVIALCRRWSLPDARACAHKLQPFSSIFSPPRLRLMECLHAFGPPALVAMLNANDVRLWACRVTSLQMRPQMYGSGGRPAAMRPGPPHQNYRVANVYGTAPRAHPGQQRSNSAQPGAYDCAMKKDAGLN